MIMRTNIVWAGLWLWCLSGGWAAATQASDQWVEPLVSEVRVPAGITDGVYYPARDELVILRPGAWVRAPAQPLVMPVQAVATGTGTVVFKGGAPRLITLAGQVKLFEALKIIAEAAGKQVVLGPGVVDTELTLNISQAPLARALRAILVPLEYGYKVNGGELVILARDTQSFRIDLPPVAQAFDTATTNESSSAGEEGNAGAGTAGRSHVRVGARVVIHNKAEALSYWSDVEAGVRNLVSKDGLVSVNKAAGVIVVTDTPRRLETLETFLKDINARAARQIMVDVKVVEVELSREHKLGIDWGALMAGGSLKGLRASTNFASGNMATGNVMTLAASAGRSGAGDTASGIKAVLKALESFGQIEVVSQPRLMMLNNAVASIQVGETRSYVESSNVETTQNGGTITSAALNEVHGGVTLQIVGSIAGEDVFLGVTPVVTSIDDIRTITLGGGSRLEAPDTSIKTMTTQVRVKDGQTVAIGGLITRDKRKEQQGVPFLCRLPVLGRLFSYEVRRNRRTELVIFMTPHQG